MEKLLVLLKNHKKGDKKSASQIEAALDEFLLDEKGNYIWANAKALMSKGYRLYVGGGGLFGWIQGSIVICGEEITYANTKPQK